MLSKPKECLLKGGGAWVHLIPFLLQLSGTILHTKKENADPIAVRCKKVIVALCPVVAIFLILPSTSHCCNVCGSDFGRPGKEPQLREQLDKR